VLGGDFLLARALELVERAGVPGALPALLAVIRRMVEGEVLQLSSSRLRFASPPVGVDPIRPAGAGRWPSDPPRRGRIDREEHVYREIVDAKTASLFGWCGCAGALAAGVDPAPLETFGFHLGRAFQIVDDVLDLEGDAAGKDLWADLRAGKLTLPVIHALAREPALERALASASDDPDVARRIAHVAARTGALGAARLEAVAATITACAALEALPATPAREALAGIAHELAGRTG
jgi:octaprenyl-diphosphate synthase